VSAGKARRLPDERGDPTWFPPIIFAASGIFLALVASHRCVDTGGTFSLADPAARPSHFCKSTGLYPGSLGLTVLTCAIYLLPAAIAVGGTLAGKRTGKRWLQWVGWFVGAGFLLVGYVLSRKANLGYMGV
jgi:hypothetical protein